MWVHTDRGMFNTDRIAIINAKYRNATKEKRGCWQIQCSSLDSEYMGGGTNIMADNLLTVSGADFLIDQIDEGIKNNTAVLDLRSELPEWQSRMQ